MAVHEGVYLAAIDRGVVHEGKELPDLLRSHARRLAKTAIDGLRQWRCACQRGDLREPRSLPLCLLGPG